MNKHIQLSFDDLQQSVTIDVDPLLRLSTVNKHFIRTLPPNVTPMIMLTKKKQIGLAVVHVEV